MDIGYYLLSKNKVIIINLNTTKRVKYGLLFSALLTHHVFEYLFVGYVHDSIEYALVNTNTCVRRLLFLRTYR